MGLLSLLFLGQVMTELETLGRAADAAAASMQFGTERKDSVAKMSDLVTKMQALQQVLHCLLASCLACLRVQSLVMAWAFAGCRFLGTCVHVGCVLV